MTKLKYQCLLIITVWMCHQLCAQSNVAMDSLFTSQYQTGLLTGNLLVANKGKVVYERSFGYQDISRKIPNTSASAFALASVSKQFTSTAVLQLKEEGKIGLDDTFTKYFPDFPFPDITIRQMLHQTTGLPNYQIFDTLVAKEPGRIFVNQDIIPALKQWKQGLFFKPGENWRYSNMNYCLLAMLVEKISAERFPDYLERHIFRPAGMKDTYLENYLLKLSSPNRTVNHDYPSYYADSMITVDSIPRYHQMIYNIGGFYGQGGLISTARDLLLFDNAFFSGKLIGKAEMDEALQPAKLNNGAMADANTFRSLGKSGYGMGWFIVADTSKGKIVWHDGGRPGISTVHIHNMLTDQTVIVLENSLQDASASAINAYQLLNHLPLAPMKVPLIQAYGQTLVKEGAEAAFIRLSLLRNDPGYRMPDDDMWLQLGYQLLFDKPAHVQLSLEALKLGCLLFPDAWHLTQAYATALAINNKKQEAILMYKKSLAQNPRNNFAKEQVRILEARP